MSLTLMQWGDYQSARALLQECLNFAPDLPLANFYMGEASRHLNNKDDAEAHYKKYLKMEPNDPMGAVIKLFNMSAIPQPTTLPTKYIECLFDQYSAFFDICLQKNLSYEAPQEAFSLVEKFCRNKKFERLLDLGCGTGLSTSPFTKYADYREGVDISQGMIDQAKGKRIYNKIYKSSIENFLSTCKRDFDLILCLDVMIYIGEVNSFISKIPIILKDNGYFVFSIQTAPAGDFLLGEDHRYSHGTKYIDTCLGINGLRIIEARCFSLREEHGKNVLGHMYLCELDNRRNLSVAE